MRKAWSCLTWVQDSITSDKMKIEIFKDLISPWPFLLSICCHHCFLFSSSNKITKGKSYHSFLKPKVQCPVWKRVGIIGLKTGFSKNNKLKESQSMLVTCKGLNCLFGFSSWKLKGLPFPQSPVKISKHDSWLCTSACLFQREHYHTWNNV